jgi:hypothetical protein
MKIWCIFKSDTAIKWRELLVVEEPSPLPCVAHNIFGELLGIYNVLVFLANVGILAKNFRAAGEVLPAVR